MIWMLLVVAKKSRAFSSLVYSVDAGTRRELSQAGSPSCPMEIFHTIDVMFSL